jgi:DNA helicase-2/ATP-dependent DNA helicase PcrA
VVGDDDQCIYQFRGSSSSYLLNFSNDFPGATEVFLNRNFRSTNKIIKYAENFIFELNGGTSEGRRKDKEFLFDEKKKSTNSNDITYTMYANNEDEASAIVKNIVQLHDKAGLAYKDIAILCRKKKQFKMISKALAYGKIPHIVKDLGDLFECEVGSGFLSLFGFIDNPSLNDRNELEKALKLINPAVSAEAIIKCFEYVESIKKGLSNFTDSEISIQRIFKTILELIEINQLDTSSKLTEVIFYELGSVSTLIDEFEKVHYLDLPNMKINKFYTLITGSLEDGGSSIEKYQKGGANKYIDIDAVNIMTVHSSKGLEYAAVFMPGLNVGTFPNNMNRHFMMGRRKVAV